ncbi:hypothetical protein SDC9_209976 [bioreactor metagenome]|uniref:Uncharacterized protein n=1 Tax=bioreactor metagenome TaxID=1076179 RepID=A0A645JHQ6_9ZZZZ
MTFSMLLTAFSTPLPRKRSPPSKEKAISWLPMETPEVHIARPDAPFAVFTTASTPGFPLTVYTCLALIEVISVPFILFSFSLTVFLTSPKSPANRVQKHCLLQPLRIQVSTAVPRFHGFLTQPRNQCGGFSPQ